MDERRSLETTNRRLRLKKRIPIRGKIFSYECSYGRTGRSGGEEDGTTEEGEIL